MRLLPLLSILALTYSQIILAETIKPSLDTIRKDFNDALNGSVVPNLNDSITWAEGTLTRTAPGKLQYVSLDGKVNESLDANYDFTKLAKLSKPVNAIWKSQYDIDVAKSAEAIPSPVKPSTVGNIDYVGAASESAKDMLVEAANQYKTGKITKDQLFAILDQVNKMVKYNFNVTKPGVLGAEGISGEVLHEYSAKAASPATTPAASASQPEKVLIGTANNGKDMVYVYRQNSWDDNDLKVQIVPGDPIVSSAYEITVSNPQKFGGPNRSGGDNPSTILNSIPSAYKIDKNADGSPKIKVEAGTRGLWSMMSEKPECTNDFASTPQPTGECEVGSKKTSYASGWANDLKAFDKMCVDKGFKKIKYTYEFSCNADLNQNPLGR